MTRKEALADLIAKVEAGSSYPFEIFNFFDTPYQDFVLQQCAYDAKNAYLGSLDAAKALHEELLPGWSWAMDWTSFRYEGALPCMKAHCQIWWFHGGKRSKSYCGATISNDNPACAWLLAILRALYSMEPDT